MKYKPLTDFPANDVNPFLKKAITEVQSNTVTKRIYLKGNRSIINQVVSDNGEILGNSTFYRTYKVDKTQFVKVYLTRFFSFYELPKNAIRIFDYLLNRCIQPNNDVFYIDFEEAMKYTGYASTNIIRAGLSSLVEHEIIARSTNPYKWYLNIMIAFNGNRISFCDTYEKEQPTNGNNKIGTNEKFDKELEADSLIIE